MNWKIKPLGQQNLKTFHFIVRNTDQLHVLQSNFTDRTFSEVALMQNKIPYLWMQEFIIMAGF